MPEVSGNERQAGLRLKVPPTVFHITHYKAGSQWVYQVLDAVARQRIILPQPNAAHVLAQPVIPGMIYPTAYVTREQFDRLHLPPHHVEFVVIRDLRDTLVSWYFHLRSSQSDADRAFRDRSKEELPLSSIQDGMRLVMTRQLRLAARIQRSWVAGAHQLFRYEDLIIDQEAQFARIFDVCQIEVAPEELRTVVGSASFERMSGRVRGKEDVSSHFRKGIAGDWENYLTGSLRTEFDDLFGAVLIAAGYEPDHKWAALSVPTSTSVRTSPSATPPFERRACWCGGALGSFSSDYGRCTSCGAVVSVRETAGDAVAQGHKLAPVTESKLVHEYIREDMTMGAGETMLEVLRAILDTRKPTARVLEVKARAGVLSELLQHAGYEVVAVEMQPRFLDASKKVFDLPLVAGPLDRIHEDLGKFDVIVLMGSVGHVPDPCALMRAARRLLSEDGVLVVTDTALIGANDSYESLVLRGSPMVSQLVSGRRVFLFTEGSLSELFKRSGFPIEKVDFVIRLAPQDFEGYPRHFMALACKDGRPVEKVGVDLNGLVGDGSQRMVKLVLNLRQDMIQLARLRDADRLLAVEQLERVLACPPFVDRAEVQKHIRQRRRQKELAGLADRLRKRLPGA